MYANACDQGVIFLQLKPRIFIDGDKWCALYGENLQDGVAGFGESPALAMHDFNDNWHKKISPPKGSEHGTN